MTRGPVRGIVGPRAWKVRQKGGPAGLPLVSCKHCDRLDSAVNTILRYAVGVAWAVSALAISATLDTAPDDPAVLTHFNASHAIEGISQYRVQIDAFDMVVVEPSAAGHVSGGPSLAQDLQAVPCSCQSRTHCPAADSSPPLLHA
jgi:hypothetical protein